MKISYNWIRDYLNIETEPEKLAEILTGIGLEVEGSEWWESVPGGLKGVVIGHVLTCQRHPSADRLFVTTVDVGKSEPLHIVCGAPNVSAGQKVPVALPGTVISKGNESLEIKISKIRGELSEGMICAEDELGLGDSHEGIMVLDESAVPGTPASEYFKVTRDYIFEIGLTPNRIDSGSHFGVARDLAAYMNLNMNSEARAKLPSVDNFRPDNNENPFEVIIENKADCWRYSGLSISNVTVSESPEWLKTRLRAVGLNPINNVVDITNYVQSEIGQPLHSFDADMIDGRKVIIRNLPDKTRFVTLDGVERSLSSRDLMICNEKEGMCIAGVFGGIKSGVTSSTRNIFLESACFNPVSIRKTSRRHGLQTDASFRFERGSDPNITVWALKRAAMLIKEIAGGEISSDVIDIYPEKIRNAEVLVNFRNIERLIGKKIEREKVRKILDLLDMNFLKENDQEILLEIPAYRVDVKKEADVIEEILRIYGYSNIETDSKVNSTLSYIEKPDKEKVVNTLSDLLSSNGFAEIMCNSLNPAVWYEDNSDFSPDALVRLANPLSSDLNVMRQSLLHGGLQSIARNINRQVTDLKMYEFGNCYFRKKGAKTSEITENFEERFSLALFLTGNSGKQSWNNKPGKVDFFHIRSAAEMVLSRLGINGFSLTLAESNKSYFSESVTYSINSQLLAEAGKISRKYLSMFDLEQDVFYCNIDMDLLLRLSGKNKIQFSELPKYPWVRRDLALLIDKEVKFTRIRELALKTEKNLLRDVELFDVYESETLGKDKKSYAVSFILRDDRKTLTDKDIDKVMNNLIRVFESELGAKIR
ncbi:MAG: phenylalanine--tRNA ligase subunit beta [Bacteroidales bacterium]|nr:phenylalanine--tRNA ligase subunit beta [Bacteroidales bacterium]